MSDINPMEHAAGQAASTAAVALQVLVMTAQALREHQQRQAAAAAQNPTPTPPAPQPTAPPNPDHERYAAMVRGTVQPADVAAAMVSAPQWPQLADELKKLEGAGVDVGQFLKDAAPVIARMDADLRTGSPTPGVTATGSLTATAHNPFAAPSGEKPERDGPGLVERFVEWVKEKLANLFGKEKPPLGDRSGDLARHGIGPQENAKLVVTAREALADETALGQLVTSREWPGIAAQMRDLQQAGHNPREALAGIPIRIQQAAAAGINLTPAEAARGLLNDQAKTSPAPAAPSTTATTETAAPKASSTAAPAAAPIVNGRAAAATAQSTTVAPGSTATAGPEAARTTPAPKPAQWRTHGR
ncbi:hypothetical protein [Streptomyces sp. HUAS TT7]|uniref:hypothetical protein n=1 Tax=Streptomyces sp. HUAS TT7 TaxID=3447507 RepID=UPI003F65674F